MPILYPDYDLLVYRATPAGIMAAITGARLKLRTLLVEPSPRIGGMMTSGLNAVDILNDSLINGVALEFFRAVRDEYAMSTLPARIESRVALKVFHRMLSQSAVHLATERSLCSVNRANCRIASAILSDGHHVSARWWVDASYEGDLMALAGIRYQLGREAREEHGEGLAGRQPYRPMLPWSLRRNIAPRHKGVLLPFVQPPSRNPIGSADMQVQSYCIRPTLTNIPRNRVPITAPPDFDFSCFELFRQLGRTIHNGRVVAKQIPLLGTTWKSAYFNLAALPKGKFDMNSGPAAPLNNPVLTKGWVQASLPRRQEMAEEFRRYTQALLYFMQKDPSVPEGVRNFMAEFGFPADEYETTGHLPPDVYVREGRRLQGQYVFRQQDIENGGCGLEDTLCEAKYHLDCKPVHWRANHSGTNVVREGMFFTSDAHRYALPAWIVLPHPEDCQNFFSVCGVSATHVAFGSIRMEPTWMELGSAAAIMAHLADSRGYPVHEVRGPEVAKLRDERFFQWPAPRFLKAKLREKVAGYYHRMAGG